MLEPAQNALGGRYVCATVTFPVVCTVIALIQIASHTNVRLPWPAPESVTFSPSQSTRLGSAGTSPASPEKSPDLAKPSSSRRWVAPHTKGMRCSGAPKGRRALRTRTAKRTARVPRQPCIADARARSAAVPSSCRKPAPRPLRRPAEPIPRRSGIAAAHTPRTSRPVGDPGLVWLSAPGARAFWRSAAPRTCRTRGRSSTPSGHLATGCRSLRVEEQTFTETRGDESEHLWGTHGIKRDQKGTHSLSGDSSHKREQKGANRSMESVGGHLLAACLFPRPVPNRALDGALPRGAGVCGMLVCQLPELGGIYPGLQSERE